jgi:RHS repeat-associated protein
MNHRIGKAVTSGSGTIQDGLLYDEQRRVVAELDGSNNVLSTFVYGLKPNVPDYMVNGGKTYRIVSDWRGDVRLVLDTTKMGAAAVLEQIDYDEWGNVTNLVDPTCTLGGTELCFQPFGFAGGLFDPTTQIVRFGARDYDPLARRWVSKDPIRFGGGETNIYVYAGNDPINNTDASGEFWPLDLARCWWDASQVANAQQACQNQLNAACSPTTCSSENSGLGLSDACLQFIDTYGGSGDADTVNNCAQAANSSAWNGALKYCAAAGVGWNVGTGVGGAARKLVGGGG